MKVKIMLSVLSVVLLSTVTLMAQEPAEKPVAPHFTKIEDALAAAVNHDRQILLDFYAPWCKYCKMLDTVVFIDTQVVKFFTNEMILAKFNAEADTALARQYRVSAFPTLVMVDKEGTEIDRIVGYMAPDAFVKQLRDYAQGIGTLDDLLHKAQSGVDSLRRISFEIADKYKYRGVNDEAMSWFKKIIEQGDAHDSLSGEARMAIADLFRRDKDYMKALVEYAAIMEEFNGRPFARDAEMWTAIVYRQKGDTATAIGAFEDYIRHYPESEDVKYAREQIERLKNPPKNKH